MIWTVIITFLTSAGLTLAIRRYALAKGLVDQPNARSSHDDPTPRGGGLAIVVAFLAASVALFGLGVLPTNVLSALLIVGVGVAAVGFWDDHGHVPIRWRISVHLLGGFLMLAVLGSLAPDFGLPAPLSTLFAVLATAWLINLYNFMDGIDGIASVEAISVALGAGLILWFGGHLGYASWLFALAAACLGFLVWNWPPAKIFMGDVGSGFLGGVFAVVGLITVGVGAMSFYSWLILLGVFVVDATFTLIRRMAGRQRWYSAHRTHAYQYAARRLGRHRPVTLGVALINLFWLCPLAWLADLYPNWGAGLVVIAFLPLLLICAVLRAGTPESHPEST